MTLRSSQGGETRVTLASPAHPASREAPEPDKQTRWGAILAMTLCGVVVAMNIGKVPIALPQLRGELGLTLVAAGWVVSMFNTLAMLTGVFFGMLGDRVGALRLCFLGLAVSFLGGLLGILSPGEELLLASRFLEGAGFIAVAVSAPALIIAATARQQLRFALGIWSTFVPAGMSLAMLFAPVILDAYGWRGMWWLVLLLLLVSIAAAYGCRAHYRLPSLPSTSRKSLANASPTFSTGG